MYQEHSQESRRVPKKRARKKKVLLRDFKLMWYIFAVFAGPAGVVLYVLGSHINSGFLFLLGFGGMLVEGVTAVVVVVAAQIARMQRYLRRAGRSDSQSDIQH